MAVEIAGFAQALAMCQAFAAVEQAELEEALARGGQPLEMLYVEPSVDAPLIRSGEAFTHLMFVQHGIVVPWQYPHSELSSPFLIGEHEFMMDAKRWVATYSAVTDAIVVGIPVSTMELVVERIPRARAQMHEVLMRRLARYYWTSLATSGSPASRVAAALISRLALNGDDHGQGREIQVRQRDIARLTVMSRSAVAAGLSTLVALRAIRIGTKDQARFAGLVHVLDVDRLKADALGEVQEREVRPLLRRRGD